MQNIENILESVLFVSGSPVDIFDITSKLDVSKKEVLDAAKNIQKRYGEDSGIQLLIFGTKLQLATNSKYADAVAAVVNPIRERQLSRATLETLSIIAYKQPVTRLEIEEIRGVASDYAINVLLEHKLVAVVGKKETVGHPVLFGTTDEFLRRFQLKSIDELPDYDTLLERVTFSNENNNQSDSLFHFDREENKDEIEIENQTGKINKFVNKNKEKPIDFGGSEFITQNDDDLL